MILRIGYIEISCRIQGQAPRIAELAGLGPRTADDLQRHILGIEDLDAAVAEFAHILAAFAVHADIVGIAQLAHAIARLAVRPDESPVTREDLDAVIAGIRHINPVLGVDAKSLRSIKLPWGGAGV